MLVEVSGFEPRLRIANGIAGSALVGFTLAERATDRMEPHRSRRGGTPGVSVSVRLTAAAGDQSDEPSTLDTEEDHRTPQEALSTFRGLSGGPALVSTDPRSVGEVGTTGQSPG